MYSREACAGQGVAYNALRLARNEIQVAHGLATDSLFAKMPWVEKEAINLSPSHPAIGCACEDVVVNGEGEITVRELLEARDAGRALEEGLHRGESLHEAPLVPGITSLQEALPGGLLGRQGGEAEKEDGDQPSGGHDTLLLRSR